MVELSILKGKGNDRCLQFHISFEREVKYVSRLERTDFQLGKKVKCVEYHAVLNTGRTIRKMKRGGGVVQKQKQNSCKAQIEKKIPV